MTPGAGMMNMDSGCNGSRGERTRIAWFYDCLNSANWGFRLIKSDKEVILRNRLFYVVENGRLKLGKPWLGDLFSFSYDFFMKRIIFPQKLGGSLNKHFRILGREMSWVRDRKILELAAGTGSAVEFLSNDNQYTGTDISPGLLKRAAERFRKSGFRDAKFYVTGAEDLPFEDNVFDICLCVLALNFFNDIEKVLREIKRVLNKKGVFFCCVPVSERMKSGSKIRGTLYSETQLQDFCFSQGFEFEIIPDDNGAVFYFKASIGN